MSVDLAVIAYRESGPSEVHMPVCRLILRIDFNTVFDLMDYPGRLAQTILETAGKDFFESVGELPQTHEVRAVTKSEMIHKEFRANPTFLLFDYQDLNGLELSTIQDDQAFSTLAAVVTAVRRAFKIDAENRAGLRLFYVNQIAKDREAVERAFEALVDQGIYAIVGKHFSKPRDFGLAMDGGASDGLRYSTRFGPFLGIDEAAKFFQDPPKKSELLETANFVVDVDQYQTMMKRGPELKWWKPLLQTAKEFIPALETDLTKRMHG